jgi:2-polyprenyl-3-methyl-5-hydroxy-6-metoxy-1,4-benzoquinol methylase
MHSLLKAESMETDLLQNCNLCDSNLLDLIDSDSNIVQCRACGYVFDNPRPTLAELITFYSQKEKYDSWLSELGPRDRLWKRRLKKLQSTRNPGSLLDVGAGIGQFLFIARGSYREVYGTEVSASAVAIAKQKYGVDLFHGSIEELAQKGKRFSNITLFHVLEHVPDPRAMLKTCHSLLEEGGCLVVAVPNELTSLRGFKKRLLGKFTQKNRQGLLGLPRLTLDGSIAEIHLSHFTPSVLRRLLEATGFSVVAETLDPYYVRVGMHRLKADLYYCFCLMFRFIFRVNIYDAILVIARKQGPTTLPDRRPV